MANQEDIKKYLLEGDNPYFKQKNRNGEILMLSGVWGSGKTHFWKNEVEKELVEKLKEKDKSYVFISLYGKDSIEELQNEIFQLSYSFAQKDNDVISSAYSVFTKVTSFMPKISVFGLEVELSDSAEKVSAENMKQQIEKGIDRLRNGGIICFDDFERKSSKIDLNDLFGFITNLTEVFKTKTIIITNQEFFKENDNEVFNMIKEKSVNKFLLLDPTVDELFETIYTDKYSALDEYRDKILEAIKITEEKNARIFIQVLDNCLEYKNQAKDKHEMFMLVIITVLFVKYNLVFKMKNIEVNSINYILPEIVNDIPKRLLEKMANFGRNKNNNIFKSKENFIHPFIDAVSVINQKEENLKRFIKYINDNANMLYQIYKYRFNNQTKNILDKDKQIIDKLNNFVESGILPDE